MTYHKEDVHYLATKGFVLILFDYTECVADGTLTDDGETAFEDGVVKLVEGYERADLRVHAVLGCGVGDLDDRAFGSFLLFINILEVYETIEDLHNELELVRDERIEVCKIFL